MKTKLIATVFFDGEPVVPFDPSKPANCFSQWQPVGEHQSCNTRKTT